MMNDVDVILGDAEANGRLCRADLTALYRASTEGMFDRQTITRFFAFETRRIEKPADWAAFFVTSVVDHFVFDVRPTGTLDEADANWLCAIYDAAPSALALTALIAVRDAAHAAPAWYGPAVAMRGDIVDDGILAAA